MFPPVRYNLRHDLRDVEVALRGRRDGGAGSLGDGGPVPIAQIAERREMPVQFLEQLFSTSGAAAC